MNSIPKRLGLAISLAAFLVATPAIATAKDQQSAEVLASEFGAKPGQQVDSTPAVADAIKACRERGTKVLKFAPGRYDFYPNHAGERYQFISNNDDSLKRIAFDLKDIKDLQIDGQGAEFVFHGFICPFVIEDSSGIAVKNLTIDFARTFHSEGKIISVNPEGMEIEFAESFPYEVRNGILVFTDGGKTKAPQTTVTSGETLFPYGSLLEFDPKKRETAFMAKDTWASGGLPAKALSPERVQLLVPGIEGTPGNVMVFGAARRDVPGFVISDSHDVTLENIKLYHCGGMGVIAQRSSDITVRKMDVTPTPGSGRVVSITADATHFVNCSGKITLEDCLFECQKDDATNIHGIYLRVERIPEPDTAEVKLVHPQQFGVDVLKPGMKVELVHGSSLVSFGEAEVKSIEKINKEYVKVTFNSALPSDFAPGDVIASIDGNHPDVVIRGCTIQGNRARGILLGSRGKILVEKNTFHTAGSAILLEGDGRFWFEQAGVRDLVIRDNVFDNCNYGVWGEGIISVGAGIAEDQRAHSRYNRNITIEDNIFRQFDTSPIIRGYCIDGLTYRNNRHEETTAYPSTRPESPRFVVSDSDNISISE